MFILGAADIILLSPVLHLEKNDLLHASDPRSDRECSLCEIRAASDEMSRSGWLD
uniref:Uncharacterized protein n=1 Tax=Rhodnius prolixus TaxID=13249 RepID=T1IA78_RHOPR